MAWSRMGTTLLVSAMLAVLAATGTGVTEGVRTDAGMAHAQVVPAPWSFDEEIPDSAIDFELQSQIESSLTGLVGRYGVAIRNLDDGRSARVNARARLEAASMYKLLVMYRVFQQIESGELRPDDAITIQESDVLESAAAYDLPLDEVVTVDDALHLMISISSNSAAYALARTVGGWDVVNSAAEEVGMRDTDWDDGYWSTPDDILHFFEVLADRRLVSNDASEAMVALLMDQSINDRIPALLPEEARVAHKTGELDNVRNDGGIVSTPRGRYVIVVMSYDVDPSKATEAIAQISRLVYDRYG